MIGSCVAIALALFACAAPSEQELEAAAQPGQEQTGEAESELRIRQNNGGCAVTCSSDDGTQTCCCDVGQKCVKGIKYCECKSAYDTRITASGPAFGAAAAR